MFFCKIPRAFCYNLTNNFEPCGLNKPELYQCIFVRERILCILYVDDIIFWVRNAYYIHDLEMELKELGVDLEQEDDADGFLGVTL